MTSNKAFLTGLTALVISACPQAPQQTVPQQIDRPRTMTPAEKLEKCFTERRTKTCFEDNNTLLVYNRKGGLILETKDNNDDGRPEEIFEYDGRHPTEPGIMRETYDRNSDGNPDRIVTEINEDKRTYVITRTEIRDDNFDGVVDYSSKTVFYPQKKRSTEIIKSEKGPRYIDSFFDNGKLVAKAYDHTGTRRADRMEFFNPEGRMVKIYLVKGMGILLDKVLSYKPQEDQLKVSKSEHL